MGEDIEKLEQDYLESRAKLASTQNTSQTDQTLSEQSSDSQCITRKELMVKTSPKSSELKSNGQKERERSASLSIEENSRLQTLRDKSEGKSLVEKRQSRPLSNKLKEKPKVPTKPASLMRNLVATTLPRRKV